MSSEKGFHVFTWPLHPLPSQIEECTKLGFHKFRVADGSGVAILIDSSRASGVLIEPALAEQSRIADHTFP